MILSIDVGIKNLALCTFNRQCKAIVRWDVIALSPVDGDLATAVNVAMNTYGQHETIDEVVIEKQPRKNKRMQSVENFLHMYFVCKHALKVSIYHPRYKLAGTGMENKGKHMYCARKKASVLLCKQWLEEETQNASWLSCFNKKGVKKDDLADALNQVLSFCKISHAASMGTLQAHATAVNARRPTEQQKQHGRYSKSNIKHFLTKEFFFKGESTAYIINCLQNDSDKKKLSQAALRHYKTLDECVAALVPVVT